jgi:hypothetical protein
MKDINPIIKNIKDFLKNQNFLFVICELIIISSIKSSKYLSKASSLLSKYLFKKSFK